MSNDCCTTNAGVTLLYPCSGAADVGELADRAARKLLKEGFEHKTCLAGIGGDIKGFIVSAQGADINIAIDGCSMLCAKKGLERVGVKPVSIMLGDLGYKKGETLLTDKTIQEVADFIKKESHTSMD